MCSTAEDRFFRIEKEIISDSTPVPAVRSNAFTNHDPGTASPVCAHFVRRDLLIWGSCSDPELLDDPGSRASAHWPAGQLKNPMQVKIARSNYTRIAVGFYGEWRIPVTVKNDRHDILEGFKRGLATLTAAKRY